MCRKFEPNNLRSDIIISFIGVTIEQRRCVKIKQRLYELAYNFRKAIETAKEAGEHHEYIIDFPAGQCGNISDIFSQYLSDLGIGPVTYVNGTYYGTGWDSWSHTWLEVENCLIDMTADQFKYDYEPLRNNTALYVGPMNEWYALFDTEYGCRVEHHGLDVSWNNYMELRRCYDIIKKYL